MKIQDMTNLWTAYNKAENFRICIKAGDEMEALEVAHGYSNDSGLDDDWKISEFRATDEFDCDYIVSGLYDSCEDLVWNGGNENHEG